MSDIVERLRAVATMDLRTGGFLAHTLDTAKEAADEIERLQRRLALAEKSIECFEGDRIERDAEIERLRRDHIGAHRISGDTIRTLEAEIERLRAAKRRALQVADERSKENVELRERLWSIREELAHIVEQIDSILPADLRKLAE